MESMKPGSIIKAERRRLGWSQTHLAARLQVTRNTVQRWESGSTLIPPSRICGLLEALGATPEVSAHLWSEIGAAVGVAGRESWRR